MILKLMDISAWTFSWIQHQVYHQAQHQVHGVTIRQSFSLFLAKNVQKFVIFDVGGNAKF